MVLVLVVITIVSVALTAVMGVITWRIVREERMRAAARMQALEYDLRDKSPVVESTAVAASFLGDREARPARERIGVVLGVGALVVCGFGALAVVVSSSSRGAATAASRVPRTQEATLELVALDHEREGDRLTVHGTVRNPD